MFSDKLSATILRICDRLGISYEKASERCGLSPRYFGSIARGQTAPTINTLEKICAGFERTPNDLLGITTADEELSYRIAMQVTQYRRGSSLEGDCAGHPVCPRCKSRIEQEYQSFCDSCGQKLAWDSYHHATPMHDR